MNKQQLLEYRERWKAVAAIELEEQRAATTTERWQQLNDIFRMAQALELPLETPEREKGVEVVRQRWIKLKEKLA